MIAVRLGTTPVNPSNGMLSIMLHTHADLTCDLQRITGYLAEAYIKTHKVQFDSTW